MKAYYKKIIDNDNSERILIFDIEYLFFSDNGYNMINSF